MKARFRGAAIGLGSLGMLLSAVPALAQDGGTDAGTDVAGDGGSGNPNCNDTSMFPNPIFLGGSSAFEPVVQRMAFLLASRKAADGVTPAPVTLITQFTASCDGPADVKSGKLRTGLATYYVTDSGAAGRVKCSLDSAPMKLDVGLSDVFYETCGLGPRPATISDVAGPAQAMLFVVPSAADQAPTSITAEEAADVWGCGVSGLVAPWNVADMFIQQRNSSSGTQNVIARAINVLASSFHGTMNGTTGNMIDSITGSANPNATIGFVSADGFATSGKRSMMRAIAFKGLEQTQAYFADSADGANDKRNTRDGHYLAWGYEHFMATLDTSGNYVSPGAKNVIDWVVGNTTTAANKPNFDPIDVESRTFVIPQCAMSVSRTTDGGFLKAYTSSDSCNCFFESKATGATPTGCLACTDNTGCTGGKTCHHNFCE